MLGANLVPDVGLYSSVMYGGLSILSLLIGNSPGYADSPLRHDLWRAGHAGVYLVLSLVMLRYVDEAVLSPFWKWLARIGAPIAAILIPTAFFLSVASPTAKQPNGLMYLAYVGALFLAAAVLSLGVAHSGRAAHGTRSTAVAILMSTVSRARIMLVRGGRLSRL